jgi:4-alpha-glucanotransferase
MSASDLELKAKLELFPSEKLMKEAHSARREDRRALLSAFKEEGLAADLSMSMTEFADAAHAFLASSASAITMVQIDDITDETTPVNVPTTSTEHPNWRRRLSMSLDEIAADPHFHSLSRLLNEARTRPALAEASMQRRPRGGSGTCQD